MKIGVLREKEIPSELRTESANLAPCKFCGKKPLMVRMQSFHRKEGRDEIWRVKCYTQKCPGKIYRYYLTREAAAYAWNRTMREGE